MKNNPIILTPNVFFDFQILLLACKDLTWLDPYESSKTLKLH